MAHRRSPSTSFRGANERQTELELARARQELWMRVFVLWSAPAFVDT